MKQFDIPDYYRSPIISEIKKIRRDKDPRKKDYTPTVLDFGAVIFYIARHFGFCYGVENAIEIAYRTISENPDKRIFLLSEMIHNPSVNNDLIERGVRFVFNTDGVQEIPWEDLTSEDIVLIPAFGTSLEIEKKLTELGLTTERYNTTCPFVEKVWNRAAQLGDENCTVIIHGKFKHEETIATFSHSRRKAPSLIIRDLEEAKLLGDIILGKVNENVFYEFFEGRFSEGFVPKRDLDKIGVVNQTTMLASETEEIADYLKRIMEKKFGANKAEFHFADTRDTLCYATNDNQRATYGLLETDPHFALVIGGYNSSNTSHIVELLEEKFTTYFISSEEKISENVILHFDLKARKEIKTEGFLPASKPVKIAVTSGASCPDSLVDRVIFKMLSFFDSVYSYTDVLKTLK